MRRFAVVLVCGLLGLSAPADETKNTLVVKEIDIKGVMLEPKDGGVGKPVVITSKDELAKVFTDKEARAKLEKEVDFDKHKLLYFAWSGSGGDRLTSRIVETGDKKEVVLDFRAGLTRDYRRHFRLFALGKNVAWKMGR